MLSADQLGIADDALSAAGESFEGASASALSLDDLTALHAQVRSGGTDADYRSFVQEAKAYASVGAWAARSLDDRIAVSSPEASGYSPATLEATTAASGGSATGTQASGDIPWSEYAWDYAAYLESVFAPGVAAAGMGTKAGEAVRAKVPDVAKQAEDWWKKFMDWVTSFGKWFKWVAIGIVALVVLYLVAKIATAVAPGRR